MAARQRTVGNVSELKVEQKKLQSGQTVEFELKVPKEQTWRIEGIEVLTAPQNIVEVKYKEEVNGNDITLASLPVYETPLIFKKTATDNHLVVTGDRTVKLSVTDVYQQGTKQVRVRWKYIKVLPGVNPGGR